MGGKETEKNEEKTEVRGRDIRRTKDNWTGMKETRVSSVSEGRVGMRGRVEVRRGKGEGNRC